MKEAAKVAAVQMEIKGMDPDANLNHMRDLIEKVMTEDRVYRSLCNGFHN